jgi:hypothetical protein
MRGPNRRPIRIVIDRDTVRDDDAASVLLNFGHHDGVEVISTDPSDGGWHMEIGTHEPDVDRIPVTVHQGSGGWTQSAVWPVRSLEIVAKSIPGPMDDVFAALVLGRAASSAHADALATRNPYLISQPRNWIRRDNAMIPEQAVALLGLNLRLRGDFVYVREANAVGRFDRGMYYWVLTRSLLPAAWRWFSACVHSSTKVGDDKLIGLGGGLLTRFERVLRARDKVHEQFHVPQDTNTADEAHFYLDIVLLQLVGAFDAAARVAHNVYSMPPNRERFASWRSDRSDGWRARLVRDAPTLAELMNPGTSARDTLELAAILRNTIHGEALQSVTVRRSGRGTEYHLFVPPSESAAFVSAARRRGGLERWGIERVHGKDFLISADRFVEALVPDAARALNRLMAATDVIRLPGLKGVRLTNRPSESRDSSFNRWTRRRVRLLSGL